MPFTPINSNTARLASNASKTGRSAFFAPLDAFGTIPANAPVDLGLFPVAEKLTPATNITSESVTAQDPNGGTAALTLDTIVTAVEITYDTIAIVTPSAEVVALHAGAPSVELTEVAGATLTPFDPGASVVGRFWAVFRNKARGSVRVVFHPRFALQSNGYGENGPVETVQFKGTVQAYDVSTLPAGLAAYAPQITAYGVIADAPIAKLQEVLDLLNTIGAGAGDN